MATVIDLRRLAKTRGLLGYSKMTKAALQTALGLPVTSTGARQQHGLTYEYALMHRQQMTAYPGGQTALFDAIYYNVPVSIKTKKLCVKSIELGDYFRQKSITDPWFLLVVGFWQGQTQNIVKECAWLISRDQWQTLFAYAHDEELKTDLQHITNLRADDGRWKQIMAKHRRQWGPGRPANLALKRDHKTQKRCQCTIQLAALQQFIPYAFPM
jgi:hypothetical protein